MVTLLPILLIGIFNTVKFTLNITCAFVITAVVFVVYAYLFIRYRDNV